MADSDSEVLPEVIRIVRKCAELPEEAKVTAGSDFRQDLGYDSLMEAETGMELEEHFNVTIPDAFRPRTVGEAAEMVRELRARSHSGATG